MFLCGLYIERFSRYHIPNSLCRCNISLFLAALAYEEIGIPNFQGFIDKGVIGKDISDNSKPRKHT